MVNQHSDPEMSTILARLQSQYERSLATTEKFARAIDAVREAYLNLMESDPSDRDTAKSVAVTRKPSIAPTVSEQNLRGISWADRLKGMTQLEALIDIAESNDGVIRPTDARDILIRAGLAKGKPRNVNSSLTRLLIESDEFERIEPGTYRLKSSRAEEGESKPSLVQGPMQYFAAEQVNES